MGKTCLMGPATPLQRALGVPWGGHLRRRLFLFEPLALGRREQHLFWAGSILSAPREAVSLVVTHQRRVNLTSATPTYPSTRSLHDALPSSASAKTPHAITDATSQTQKP